MPKLLDPPVQIREAFFDEGLDLLAGSGRAVTKLEQGCDVLEREAVGLRSANEPEALKRRRAIDSIVPLRPAVRR